MSEDRILTRVPPHDLESEMALLAAAWLDPEHFGELRALVSADQFYAHRHQKAWTAMEALADAGEFPDHLSTFRELRRDGMTDSVLADLSLCLEAASSPVGARQWARAVRDAALRRRVLAGTVDVQEAAWSDEPDVVARLRALLDEVEQAGESAGGSIAVGLDEALERLATPVRFDTGEGGNLAWRIRELDTRGCFVRPTDFVIVAGSPGVGKTTWVLRWAYETARLVDRPVVFASLEMDPGQVREKVLLAEAGVRDPGGLGVRPEDEHKLRSAADYLAQIPLMLPENIPQRIDAFTRWARGVIHRDKPCALVLDYLGLLDGVGENATTKMGDVSKKVRAISKDTGCPVISIHNMNRSSEHERRPPERRDLRQSGQIDFDATHIMFLWRPAEAMSEEESAARGVSRDEVYLIGRKFRRGPPFVKVKMRFDASTSRLLPVEE